EYDPYLLQKSLFESETYDEQERSRQRTGIFTLLAVLTGLLVIIVWLLRDDLRTPMVWFNRWTPIVALFFILHVIMDILHKLRRRKEEEEEADQEDQDQEAF
ncbi:MAG: hypothetical protein LBD12_06655, partial [Clostridiales Family XIII bacterium]|nr:hypothetical protein [Clostridiales Family XIII bacterium]